MHYEKDRLVTWSSYEAVGVLQILTPDWYILEESERRQLTYLDGEDSMNISMTLILLNLNVS